MRAMKLKVGIKTLKKGANIFDIEVPEKLRHRISSNINWIDDALGGEGFTPSVSMMLTGMPGCGKTTMAMQLADSLTKAGHVVLYNTGEESLYQVRIVADRLKLKNGFLVGQDIMVKDVLAHASELIKKNPNKQVFLIQDSLQTLDDGYYRNGTTSMTPVRCCEQLTDWAKTNYGVVVFIGQVTKNGEFAGKNQIKHTVDVHAHLYFDMEKKSDTYGERLFEVQKNRFGANGKTYIVGMDKTGLYEKGHFVLDAFKQ